MREIGKICQYLLYANCVCTGFLFCVSLTMALLTLEYNYGILDEDLIENFDENMLELAWGLFVVSAIMIITSVIRMILERKEPSDGYFRYSFSEAYKGVRKTGKKCESETGMIMCRAPGGVIITVDGEPMPGENLSKAVQSYWRIVKEESEGDDDDRDREDNQSVPHVVVHDGRLCKRRLHIGVVGHGL